jgi:hypothetical protein
MRAFSYPFASSEVEMPGIKPLCLDYARHERAGGSA